jgi:hypothetical protein
MPTQHLHRVLLVVPAARADAFNSWVKSSGLDPQGGDWLAVGLSPTGEPPPTFYWCSTAMTNQELKLFMQRLCSMSGIAPPATWDTMSRQQKKQWLLNQRQEIRQQTGVWVAPMDNDGVWDNPADALAAVGLQVIRPAMVPA